MDKNYFTMPELLHFSYAKRDYGQYSEYEHFLVSLVKIICLNHDLFPNFLIIMFLASLGYCSGFPMVPSLSDYFGKYSVVVTDSNDGQNYKNKSQAATNWSYLR